MKVITPEILMDFYVDTINKCGTYLLNESDEVIGYNIFEEFDIGVISFLHIDNLKKLNESGFISKELVEKSSALRSLFLEMHKSGNWNVQAIKNLPKWKRILELADEIRGLILICSE